MLDEMISRIPTEMLQTFLRNELLIARTAKPFPYLVYHAGLSFSEKMLLRDISASSFNTSWDELRELERLGAALAVRYALQEILEGDLLIDHVPVLIRFVNKAMKRYQLSLDFFQVTEDQINLRERAYWYTQGLFFTDCLRVSQGVLGTTESRTWYLHEIRLAAQNGKFHSDDFGLEHNLYYFSVRRLHHELKNLLDEMYAVTDRKTRTQLSNRYSYLRMIADDDLAEFPI
ncbi:MAG: hypothetical protein NTX72_04035 [Candidatus Uhrbacteria bacterium]|nr:hypothetical protein [Candidatus Uhrbacteria bacterium]